MSCMTDTVNRSNLMEIQNRLREVSNSDITLSWKKLKNWKF